MPFLVWHVGLRGSAQTIHQGLRFEPNNCVHPCGTTIVSFLNGFGKIPGIRSFYVSSLQAGLEQLLFSLIIPVSHIMSVLWTNVPFSKIVGSPILITSNVWPCTCIGWLPIAPVPTFTNTNVMFVSFFLDLENVCNILHFDCSNNEMWSLLAVR